MLTFEPLRKILKERGISSYYLRYKCGSNKIDQKTLKRLLTDKSVSTNTLNSLCNLLSCDISDIVKYIPDSNNDTDKK